jgi:transglycosylase-like protein
MRRLLVVTVASLAASMLVPDMASADMSDCPRKLERSYSKHYRQVAKRLGTRAPGRNIRKYGVLFKRVKFHAVCSEVRRSNKQLVKLLKSPPYSHSQAVPPRQPPAGVKSDRTVANGGSSNPMVNPACESGGNPQVVDPSGTYWGKYQFDYGTWVAHGGAPGAYGNAPEWVQDEIASHVTYDAWPNC